MKKIFGVLCIASLAFAHIALADDNSTVSTPAASETVAAVSTNTTKSLETLWPASDGPARRIIKKGVPNFGKLNNAVWRSGQPTKEGYQSLAEQGIKTVVNLRVEFPQDKDLLPKGVNYVYIPIKDQHEPTTEQAKAFIDVVSNPDNWPVLVHCKGGEGRAGVMAALVRHSFDGWNNKKIMQEVSNFRVKHLGFIKIGMQSCQKKFIQEWGETPNVVAQQKSENETDKTEATLATNPK
jgi:protein tyrosine phosphatase (PTP) superfamily phosphohydrolase (DUF442 family)